MEGDMNYKHNLIIIFTFILMSILCVQNFSFALDFGNNITIYDNTSSSTYGWYGQQEDNEVEPGCINTQIWDLEGFFLDNYTLTIIGGFDFASGVKINNPDDIITSGDIFIDIDGDVTYGGNQANPTHRSNGIIELNNAYGYDYAIRLNFDNNQTWYTYEVYEIKNTVYSVYYGHNDWSNPWKYKEASDEQPIYTGLITYYDSTQLDSMNLGLAGDNNNNNHYAFSVDLSFLPHGAHFISHFTIECGNDNLMGQGALPAPEPATIFLFGSGLIGFAVFAKRKMKSSKST